MIPLLSKTVSRSRSDLQHSQRSFPNLNEPEYKAGLTFKSPQPQKFKTTTNSVSIRGLDDPKDHHGRNQASQAGGAELVDQARNALNNSALGHEDALGLSPKQQFHNHTQCNQTNRNACQSCDCTFNRTDDVSHHILR